MKGMSCTVTWLHACVVPPSPLSRSLFYFYSVHSFLNLWFCYLFFCIVPEGHWCTFVLFFSLSVTGLCLRDRLWVKVLLIQDSLHKAVPAFPFLLCFWCSEPPRQVPEGRSNTCFFATFSSTISLKKRFAGLLKEKKKRPLRDTHFGDVSCVVRYSAFITNVLVILPCRILICSPSLRLQGQPPIFHHGGLFLFFALFFLSASLD